MHKLNKVKVEFYKRNFLILSQSFSSLLDTKNIFFKKDISVQNFFRCKRIVLCCVKRSQFSAIDRCCLEKFPTHPQKHSVKRRTVNKICKIILVPRMSVPKNIDSYRLQSPSRFLSSLSINYFTTI